MKDKRRFIIITVLTAMILTIGAVGAYFWYENQYFVATEDAKVTGDLVKVSAQIGGKLLEFNLEEGQLVEQNQIVGRQEMIGQPDYNLDLSMIRTPIAGLVLKKQGNIGEYIAPGTALAMLVDPNKLYINANIEETDIGRIKPGQLVDITLDQYPDRKYTGTISSIGQATAATFSMLPASTGGNFTKVVQKIPVKIGLNDVDVDLLPGINAVVKVHVK